MGASVLQAQDKPLIVHASEIGIAKFHRYDMKEREHGKENIWTRYALDGEPNSKVEQELPFTKNQEDGSVTVYFSTMEELFAGLKEVGSDNKRKIEVLNIHAHGLPGGIWFPKDKKERASWDCATWRSLADGTDKSNYDQYYHAVELSDIKMFRDISEKSADQVKFPCTVGAKEFGDVVAKDPTIKDLFASDTRIHFFSCLVGLGSRGAQFVSDLAKVLLNGEESRVEAALQFGLGDWSMPDGMGFWDYQNDAQMKRDMEDYPTAKEDRKFMQKGQVRIALFRKGEWQLGVSDDLDVTTGDKDNLEIRTVTKLEKKVETPKKTGNPKIWTVRIPGTNVRISGIEN